ncbi:hypothetical protein IEQ34_008139 [Dendrobium chrysotoxum]|uniref:Uncharacterized protein n=1 Tax=Dendrobium chrysotoxum TaxID=161865 RepID=A0AAV7H3Q7_DENCH|nr:hypothetical protein IEQ34_008139 [Dendrobium chrysotoxum]
MTGQHGFKAIRWLDGSPIQARFLLTILVPPDADLSRMNPKDLEEAPHPYGSRAPIGKYKCIESWRNLKTCINFVDVLTKNFKSSKSIQLLYIYISNFKLISKAIRYLMHLQYFEDY